MANIRKTFNFRNGVQVDDDNLVVNTNGLVGIGTSVPTENLEVRGTSKFVGLVTATEVFGQSIRASGVSTFSGGIRAGLVSINETGIVTATSGIITYYGDGGSLSNLPTSQWLDIDVGLGFTSIYAQGFVGVNTNSPIYPFQVAGSVANREFATVGATGVGIDSTGNIYSTGIVTATAYNGSGGGITNLNASNVSSGTLDTNRLPSNINVSGIVTATTFRGTTFIGSLTGTASTAQSLTGMPDITVGDITSSTLGVGTVTAGAISATSITNTGSLINGGSITNTNLITTNSLTASDSVSSTNLLASGISTATTLLHVGAGGTGLSASNAGKIGIGTAVPTSDLQIRKASDSLLEVVSESGESKISLGQLVGAGNSTGVLRFGNQDKTLDLINNDTGNINTILHAGSSGIGTGKFSWQYGQTFLELMSLNYNGDISVRGATTLASSGGITTTGGDLYVNGNVTATNFIGNVSLPSIIASNLNVNTGVSTVTHLDIVANTNPLVSAKLTLDTNATVGLGTTQPIVDFDARDKTALFGSVGINTTDNSFTPSLYVGGNVAIEDSVGIGTTATINGGSGLEIYTGFVDLYDTRVSIESNNTNVSVIIDDKTTVGIGSTQPKAAVDLSLAGKGGSGGQYAYLILPKVTNSERSGFASTESGAIIFNTDTSTFQGYTGIGWTDLH